MGIAAIHSLWNIKWNWKYYIVFAFMHKPGTEDYASVRTTRLFFIFWGCSLNAAIKNDTLL